MELYFLDERFSRMTNPIDTALSVAWNLRFFECGSFRVIFPASKEILFMARQAKYLCSCVAGTKEVHCGRIEYIGYVGEDEVEVSGRMLECLLGDRVITSPYNMTDSVCNVVFTTVIANLRGIFINIDSENSDMISDVVTATAAWDDLSDWIYRMLRPYGASYTITLDVDRGGPVFRLVRPSTDVSAIFSASFENISEVTYEYHATEMKNAIIVEGYDGTTQIVDLSDGGERRELYKRASDIRPTAFDTTAAYLEALRTQGQAILSQYNTEEYISCAAAHNAFPIFGVDYRLGDFCYVDDGKTGISLKTRVTEADEVWEDGIRTVYPAFGGRLPGIRNKLNKYG